ncbi:MAG TPA: sigma-70 family RNA polymerase sigma factor [Planctomycetaceae bacterium]|nr:sigma-70 family RNA polymerase sigma factor [Planctomycetaceae bacterium]
MTTSDLDLLIKLQQGETAAFAAVIERYQRAVYGYLRARLTQASDAEDLTQEVFLRCYEARARFDTSSLLLPWLIGIARNLLRERVRRLHRRREVVWTELCLELETMLPASDLADDAELRALPECLSELGPSAREAIELHYRAEHRLATIAALQHRSEGAVKLLLHRARQALRDCLSHKRRKAEQP